MIDPSIFAEIADALGLASPAIPEKDFYAVEALKCLGEISSDVYSLVFVGGTCLSKVHINTYRMSEDIDIKLVLNDEYEQKTKAFLKTSRKDIYRLISSLIDEHPNLKLKSHDIKNEYCYQQFIIEYPKKHTSVDSLRPHIKLDITEAPVIESPIKSSISSLYTELSQLEPEINAFSCATINEIASEKLVGLLRRIAYKARNNTFNEDPALIRHAYDLHLIYTNRSNVNLPNPYIQKVIDLDIKRFGNRHNEFTSDPVRELNFGLTKLNENTVYQERYDKYIVPLIYRDNPASWHEAIESVESLMKNFIDKLV